MQVLSHPINQYGLVLSSVPSQGGTTTGSGVYDSGEVVRVIARPMQGYKFAGWEGAEVSDKNESNTTVLVTEDISLSARFEELEYSVEVTAGVGGSTSGSGTYNYGEVVIIEAVPAVGYGFAHGKVQKLKILFNSYSINCCFGCQN